MNLSIFTKSFFTIPLGDCIDMSAISIIILIGLGVPRPKRLNIENDMTLMLAPKSASALLTVVLPIIHGSIMLPRSFSFGSELKNMMSNEIKNVMSSFFQMQSPSGSGSLPSNTVANPRGDVKAITTRSGVSYNGPTITPTPSLSKEVERKTYATKDKVQNTSLGSTTHVQPSVVQDPIPEPEVATKTNPKPSIPYPSRLNDQKLREKANN
ncbi:hypothetical protein Tco_1464555 [Tanacetum coccineum]